MKAPADEALRQEERLKALREVYAANARELSRAVDARIASVRELASLAGMLEMAARELEFERLDTRLLEAADKIPPALERAHVQDVRVLELERRLAEIAEQAKALKAAPATPEPVEEPWRGARCRGCDAPIVWQERAALGSKAKRSPNNPDGSSHFKTCPEAKRFSGRNRGR